MMNAFYYLYDVNYFQFRKLIKKNYRIKKFTKKKYKLNLNTRKD